MNSEVFSIMLAVLGAILGWSISYILKFLQFFIGHFFRKEILTGTWHSYHYSRIHGGKRVLRYDKWEIRRNLLNKLRIKSETPAIPDLKYKGTISWERNYLLVSITGESHKERAQMRFFDIIPTGQDIAFGLALAVDFDNQPLCVVKIMSRKKLSKKEATKLLDAKTKIMDKIFTLSRFGNQQGNKNLT